VLLGLCVFLRVVSILRPCLSDDEATYAVVAREMLTGHELYRDVVDHKPPAIYVVYAATQAVAGPTGGMIALHLLLIGVVFATALVLARIVRLHGPSSDPKTPLFAALLWIVFTTTLVDVDSLAANCELFMMLPIVGSAALFLDARGRTSWLVASGALVGIAALFKYQGAIQLPLLAFGIVIAKATWQRRLGNLVAVGVGFALPFAATGAILWATGGLDAALFWFKFNFSYIEAGSSTGEVLGRFVARGGLVIGAAALVYVLAGVTLWRSRRDSFVRFVALWLVLGGLAVSTGGRFFGHYFHQATAPLVVLAAPAAAALWARHRNLVIGAIAIPAVAFFALGAMHDQMMKWYGEPDPDYASVVSWLDDRGPGAICIWGNSPVLYFEANRPLGCRFVFANYLTGASPATATQTDPDVDSSKNVVPEAWTMLGDDLATRRPAFIIDASPGNVAFYGKYPPSRFPQLQHVLDCAYAPQATVIGMRIYQRLDVPRCSI
jgi:4-amino-4-deoxy-L-arabinose transferase-like glycosyltransferase